MATRVNVTSIEAIEDFRASLILYISKARPALEEVSAEVGRTRVWLQSTQRVHWEGIAKRRARALEETKAALFNAKMSLLDQKTSAEQLAYIKARRAFDEAEDKLRVLRRWDRDFDNRMEPPTRQLEKLHTILGDELTKALHYLTEVIHALDDYTGGAAPAISTDLPTPPAQDPAAGSNQGDNVMSLRNNGTRLAMVTKELLVKWRETREHWQDAKSDEFERRFLDELQGSVDRAVIVIEELDKIITKIKKDCE